MVTFLTFVASNAVLAACLAGVATVLTRIWRSPHLAHALWLLVLIKLVTPPLVHVPADRLVWGGNTESNWAIAATELASSGVLPDEGAPAIVTAPGIPQVTRSEGNSGHRFGMEMWDVIVTSWPHLVLAGWILGTSVFIVISVCRHLRLLRLIAASQPAGDQIDRVASHLAQQVGLTACPRFRVVAAQVSPFVAPGLIAPTVILPIGLLADLTCGQMRSMLAHELAHIRRRDHWTRVFEICVLSLNWWNPVAWWASRGLRLAEEQCCDAWVIWVLPDMRRAYGQALLCTVDYLSGDNVLAIPAGTSFFGCQLERRIEMVMNSTVSHRISLAAIAVALVVAAIILPVGAALGPTSADQEPTAAPPPRASFSRELASQSTELGNASAKSDVSQAKSLTVSMRALDQQTRTPLTEAVSQFNERYVAERVEWGGTPLTVHELQAALVHEKKHLSVELQRIADEIIETQELPATVYLSLFRHHSGDYRAPFMWRVALTLDKGPIDGNDQRRRFEDLTICRRYPATQPAMALALMALTLSDAPMLDEDYRINVVMKHLGLTTPATDPEQRSRWLEIYTYITRPVAVAHVGRELNAPPPEPPKEEGYMGTRVMRLQNPKDKEQKRVANILLTQPVPKERTEHYEAVLKRCFLMGWGLQISGATTTGDVTRVTALWLPHVRVENYRGRPASVNNPLIETWEVKGDEAKLVETTSPGDAYIASW